MFTRTRYRRKPVEAPTPAPEISRERVTFRTLHTRDGRYRSTDWTGPQFTLDKLITITLARCGTSAERVIDWRTVEAER